MNQNAINSIEVVRPNAVPSDLDKLTGNTGTLQFYCSIKDDGTRESKVAIYNAINNVEKSLDECKGEVINVVNVVAHPQTITNNDGEIIECLRIVLIDENGVGYHTVASGVMNSLEKIFNIVGMPTYNPPLAMIPREQKTRNGYKTLLIDLA